MNVQKLMKQMQKVQEDAQRIQNEMASALVEGTAGGGAIRVVLTGAYEVREVKISQEVMDPPDTEMLEDLMKAAFEDALGKVSSLNKDAMAKALGGVQIPGMGF